MNTPAKKPREFWIDDTCRGDSCQKTTCCVFDSETDECIHVIPYAAYARAIDALKIIADENEMDLADKTNCLLLIEHNKKIARATLKDLGES